MEFGFVDVILSLSSYRHVSATHVAIFRVVRTRWAVLCTGCVIAHQSGS